MRSLRVSFILAFLVAIVSVALAVPAQAQAQPEAPARSGVWGGFGLGFGSLGCDDCDGRESGLSGQMYLGGALSPRVLLGVGTNGWSKSEDGVRLTVGTLSAIVRFYPSATGRFFLLGGLGIGSLTASVEDFGSETETGTGGVLGLGYDIPLGRSVSLTPFWNGFAMQGSNNVNANVGQIGIGLTWH